MKPQLTRRHLLSLTPFLFTPAAPASPSSKPLRGIFPIAQSPFTPSNQLDLDSLTNQLRFLHRTGVHGFVWPQLASEWQTLSESERFAGAEAIAATAKTLKPAIVLGVQAADIATAIRYAKHAEKLGADAIISLPPPNQSDPAAIHDYYRQIGDATPLPLFLQAVGNLSVDAILAMYKAIPTLRYVKDEAGQPLTRFASLHEGSHGELKIFTGNHGRTLIDEMIRGFSGSMPAASFADVYASAWDLWHARKQAQAVREFGAASILIHELSAYPDAMKYILYRRGIFKTFQSRRKDPNAAPLDEATQKVLDRLLDLLKPYLKA